MSVGLAVLLLARIVVGEAGWQATPDDVAAHHAAIESRAANLRVSYVRGAQIHSPKHTGEEPNLKRPWIAELELSARRPPSLRAKWAPWRKGHWERLVGLARQAHRGALAHRCEAKPTYWGSPTHPVDQARIRRGIASGFWRVVDCGDTANVFLALERQRR